MRGDSLLQLLLLFCSGVIHMRQDCVNGVSMTFHHSFTSVCDSLKYRSFSKDAQVRPHTYHPPHSQSRPTRVEHPNHRCADGDVPAWNYTYGMARRLGASSNECLEHGDSDLHHDLQILT